MNAIWPNIPLTNLFKKEQQSLIGFFRTPPKQISNNATEHSYDPIILNKKRKQNIKTKKY